VDSSKIAIKGMSEGLVLTLGQGELADLLSELERVLEDKAAFFKGGQIALQMGPRELSAEEIEHIRALLGYYQISLGAVIEKASRPKGADRASDLEAQAPRQESHLHEGSSGLLVRGTLRSGQLLSHPGHVVIIGDVNPGAEVVAEGDIVIWGKLRGTVHAGAQGDEEAVVCALQLTPIQVRIAGYIARSPDRGDQVPIGPEIARIQDGRIVAEPWMESRGNLLP